MIAAVQLNIYRTGLSPKKPLELHRKIKKLPEGFPLPSDHNIIQNTPTSLRFMKPFTNGMIFCKEFTHETFSPFYFKQYSLLNDSFPELKETSIHNKLVYLSDSITNIKCVKSNPPSINHNIVAFNDSSMYQKFKSENFQLTTKDSIKIIRFNPRKIVVNTHTRQKTFINLLQSNFKGWNVYIDGKKVPHYTSNILFISSILPKGDHTVIFEYRNNFIVYLFFIIYGLFFIAGITLFILYFKQKKCRTKILMLIPVVILSILFVNSLFRKPFIEKRKNIYKKINHQIETWKETYSPDSLQMVLNIDDEYEFNKYRSNHKIPTIIGRYYYQNDINNLYEQLDEHDHRKYLIYCHFNTLSLEEVNGILHLKYPNCIQHLKLPHGEIRLLKKEENLEKDSCAILIGYESNNQYLKLNKNLLDSNLIRTGKYSLKIDTNQKYGSTFYLERPKDFSGKKNITVKGYYILPETTRAYLVIKFFNEDKIMLAKHVELSKTQTINNHWDRIIFTHKIPDNAEKIQIFYWKPGNNTALFVDDTEIVFH